MKSILAIALLAAGAASAQDYPNKPIRVIVPYAAGGLPDTITRLIQVKMADSLGQQLVVENRGGAGGISGTEAVAKAAPDGYTLLVADVGQVAINPHIFSKLPYGQKDLVGVGLIANSALFITLHQSVPANSFKDFIAYVKANPGKVNLASSGNGTSVHLSGEMFMAMSGAKMQHVPYRGAAPAITDLLGGQVQVIFDNMPSILQHVRAGSARALAVTSTTKSSLLPDVPVLADTIPGYEASALFGMGVPKNTPKEVIAKLNKEINEVLAEPAIKARLVDLGGEPLIGPPEAFGAMIVAETDKWKKVIEEAKVAKVQ